MSVCCYEKDSVNLLELVENYECGINGEFTLDDKRLENFMEVEKIKSPGPDDMQLTW